MRQVVIDALGVDDAAMAQRYARLLRQELFVFGRD
jgi:hypothetical protein